MFGLRQIPYALKNRKVLYYHSHKKRKDSLETRAEPAVFSLC